MFRKKGIKSSKLAANKPKSNLRIVNISCLADFKTPLDLNYLQLFIENCKLDQSQLNTLVVKINGTTVLLFKTGKAVITGAKKRKTALDAAKLVIEQLHLWDHPEARLGKFRITNIVVSAKVNFKVDLNKFYYAHDKLCSYEVELFPGLIFKETGKVSSTIFRDGSFFCTGFSNCWKARKYTQNLYKLLYDYKIN